MTKGAPWGALTYECSRGLSFGLIWRKTWNANALRPLPNAEVNPYFGPQNGEDTIRLDGCGQN